MARFTKFQDDVVEQLGSKMTDKYKMAIPQTAADPTVMRIFPEVAKEIGLNKSIVLLQIAFLIKRSKTYVEGNWWTWQPIRKLREEYFPWWSNDTVKRTVNSLEADGYLISSQFNLTRYDRTKWYALNIEKCNEIEGLTWKFEDVKPARTRIPKMEVVLMKTSKSAKSTNRKVQNAPIDEGNLHQPIPEMLTETVTETDDVGESVKKTANLLVSYGWDIEEEAFSFVKKYSSEVVEEWIDRAMKGNINNIPAFVHKMVIDRKGRPPRKVRGSTVDESSDEYRNEYFEAIEKFKNGE
jgi:hypothetical protein